MCLLNYLINNNQTAIRILSLRLKALATIIDEYQKNSLPKTREKWGKSLNG